MNIYRILIFITNYNIHVVETLDKCTIKKIGFHGNEYFRYENTTDIDVFYEELTDHYNVNDLSELNMHIYIIDCNSNKRSIMAFLQKASSCNHVSVYKVEDVIPAVLTQKHLHINSEDISIKFIDKTYTYTLFSEYYSIKEGNVASNQISLSIEDFISLLYWDRDNFSNYNELNNQLNMKNTEIDKLKNEIHILSQSLSTMKKELDAVKEKEKSREIVKHRMIIHANNPPDKHLDTWIITESVEDAVLVNKGDDIGYLKKSHNNITETSWRLYANRSGKIAWLQPNDYEIYIGKKPNNMELYLSNGYQYSKLGVFGLSKNKYPAVAIIGDENDDADEMRKWYRQNFEI